MFHKTKVFNKSQIKQVARFIIVIKRKLGGSPAQILRAFIQNTRLSYLASAIEIIEFKEANRVAHELAESSFFLNKSSCIWVDEPSAFLKVYNHK
jgi:hypothetical protein